MSLTTLLRRRGAAAAALLLAGTMLAGCNTTRNADYPLDYRERHPIVIAEQHRTHTVFVGQARANMNATQRHDLALLAEEWRDEGTGAIVIETPSGTGNELAASRVASEIKAVLTQSGVPPQVIDIRPYPADRTRFAPILVSYPRVRASAGPCGAWPQDLGPGGGLSYFANRPHYGLGCATQRNIAAMVDNPSDLVQPRAETPPYTPRRTTTLDRYVRGEDPSTRANNENLGRISEVGR